MTEMTAVIQLDYRMNIKRIIAPTLILVFILLAYASAQDSQEGSLPLLHSKTNDNNNQATLNDNLVDSLLSPNSSALLRQGLKERWTKGMLKAIKTGDKGRLEEQLLNMQKMLMKSKKKSAQRKEKGLKYNQFVESPAEAALIGKESLTQEDIQTLQPQKQQASMLSIIWQNSKSILIFLLFCLMILKLVMWLREYNLKKQATSLQRPSEERQILHTSG